MFCHVGAIQGDKSLFLQINPITDKSITNIFRRAAWLF